MLSEAFGILALTKRFHRIVDQHRANGLAVVRSDDRPTPSRIASKPAEIEGNALNQLQP